MKVAVDTNVFVYGEGLNGDERAEVARNLVAELPVDGIVVPAQVLGEFFNVLIRKGGYANDRARAAVVDLVEGFEIVPTSPSCILSAIDLAADHRLNIWDAVILSAAASAGCRLLLSEDMHEGFAWGGVTVVNPFAPVPHPLLADLLNR